MKYINSHAKGIKGSPPWKILFFGTDNFSLKALQALCENMMMPSGSSRVVEILDISHPVVKKPTSVLRYAQMCGLRQQGWPLCSKKLHNKRYDVAVLASFGHLIPKAVVDAFPYGIINIHPSLLPRWRGAAPLHHTILNGDSETGVSIMSIKPKHFDVGPLLLQRKVQIPERPIFTTLRDSMAHEGGKMVIEVLQDLPEAVAAERLQDTEGVTYAHKLTPQNSYLDWSNQRVDEIDRHYRTMFEMTELRTDWQGTTVRMMELVHGARPCVELDPSSPPGFPVYDGRNNVIWVRCKDGWAAFSKVSIRKKMSAKSFFNGYLSKPHLKGVCFKSIENNLFDDNYEKWIHNRRPS